MRIAVDEQRVEQAVIRGPWLADLLPGIPPGQQHADEKKAYTVARNKKETGQEYDWDELVTTLKKAADGAVDRTTVQGSGRNERNCGRRP